MIEPTKNTLGLRAVLGQRYDMGLLARGDLRVQGPDIEFVDAGKAPGGLFREGLRGDYAICEQAFSHYLIARDQGRPLTAIPVFTSHFCPQYTIFVRREADIWQPQDLVGKRVAMPDFGYNPAVWARGMLAEQYSVPVDQIVWLESERRPILGDFAAHWGPQFTVQASPSPQGNFGPGLYGFTEAVAHKHVDAIILPRRAEGTDDLLRPLIASPYSEALPYMRRIGGVPINTVLTLTDETVRRYPLLPAALLQASARALAIYTSGLERGDADAWHQDLDLRQLSEDRLFPWSYGVAANRSVIETMLRYCLEQGIIRTTFRIEDLFAAQELCRP